MNRINVFRPSMPPIEEYIEEIRDIWDNRWLTNMGPKYQKLTQELRNFWNNAQVSLFCSGHQALEAAFSVFPAGSEIITTPFTFASTTLAILRAGLIPVFCDIEPNFYTLDPEKIEPLITEKTVAVAPVHVYGNLCNWRRIREVADRHGLKIIYDAAHAFGVRDGEITAGNLGDISMFSLHATKVFHSIEGGCLVYNDPALTEYFAARCHYGMYDKEQVEILGTNAHLTEFAAAMGLCNFRHLDEYITSRRDAVQRYRAKLSEVDGLILCQEQPGVTSNYAYMPVRVEPESFGCSRDVVTAHLAEHGIFARKYFYPLTSQFPLCQKMLQVEETPIAAQVSSRILCLPLYTDMTVEDMDRICEVILDLHSR